MCYFCIYLAVCIIILSSKIQAMELVMSQRYKKLEAELTNSGTSICEVLARISARRPAVLTGILRGISQSLQASDKTVS